ncbi:MAG: hypothetical protein IPK80_10640 [Nannocystis sp.]|nr:hypothetical protein [Nannocystis sp.]
MRSTDALLHQLKQLGADLEALIGQLARVDEALEVALKASLISKKIAELVAQLYDLLAAAHAVLMALGKVPYVNVVAEPLAQVVGKIKDAVRPVKEQLERLESAIAPLRKKLQEALGPLRAVTRPIRQLGEFVANELGQLERAASAASSLPESRFKRAQQARLEEVSEKIAGAIAPTIALLKELRKVFDAMMPEIAAALDASRGLVEAARLITDLIGDVEEVSEDASSLNSLLDQKIVGDQTARQIVSMIGGIPEELMKPVMDALAEPLRALKEAMGIRLPDPLTMIAGFEALKRRLDGVKEALDANAPRLQQLGDKGGLEKTLGAIAP